MTVVFNPNSTIILVARFVISLAGYLTSSDNSPLSSTDNYLTPRRSQTAGSLLSPWLIIYNYFTDINSRTFTIQKEDKSMPNDHPYLFDIDRPDIQSPLLIIRRGDVLTLKAGFGNPSESSDRILVVDLVTHITIRCHEVGNQTTEITIEFPEDYPGITMINDQPIQIPPKGD
jgi:hypothetical protein